MRDVKNKICTNCDLIALLEDDTGMEASETLVERSSSVFIMFLISFSNVSFFQLLVNSKIISLDLPVKEVYKKIWCPQGEVNVHRSISSELFS